MASRAGSMGGGSSAAWSSQLLPILNGLLVLAMLAELGWFLWMQRQSVIPPGLTAAGQAPSSGQAAGVTASDAQEPVESLAAAATRVLFQSATAGDGGSGAPDASATVAASAFSSRLTLIGVVDGDPPQAIIEDAEGKKTLFVSVGQQVAGGPVVEAITKNRVTLNLNGAKIELSL